MSSSRRFESKLQSQRISEAKTQELQSYLKTDKMLGENFRSDDRVVAMRHNKEMMNATKEHFMQTQLEAAESSRMRGAQLRDQEERLVAAVASKKAEKTRELKNIQRVVEQSEELRELEEKLKAAYVNKEREAQLYESAALAAEMDAKEAEIAKEMEEQRQRGLQAEAYREYLREQDGVAMRRQLDEQIAEKEHRKQQAYDEFLREKEMVDKVVAAIMDEELQEQKARHAKEEETRRYIDEFIAERENYKAQRAAEIEAENEEIREYAEKVMTREAELRAARERDQNNKDAILEQLSAEMARRQADAEEMENLRNELIIQENEERIIQKEKEKMERAVQQRLDVALANEYQRQLKAIKREEEKKEEEAFRVAMMEKFAEDDRIDMLNAQRRREKQQEHRKQIEVLLEQRREQFAAERARELHEHEMESRVAEIRRQIIEEERKRMLAAAAKNLGLHHLPKGVLSSEDDKKLFQNA
uniref:Meiosis-specific nuclear structural protein 1 n=1 Tax=Chrysotila carterae TaxID=13221 RepID=A0A7S4F452_CHRCT